MLSTNYRTFGKTKVRVSELALGTMHFKWIISEKQSFDLLDNYVDLGGNLIDTADMYTQWGEGLSGGEAETTIGKWMGERKNREQIFLTTKVRSRMWEGVDGDGLSRAHIIKACDASLKRLQTDHIDLYMSHWPDSETSIEETTAAYGKLIDDGKVKYIGLSNYGGAELERALEVSERIGVKYVCIEPHYNLLNRNSFELGDLAIVREKGIAVIPYSPLAGGFLTGAYREEGKLPDTLRAKFTKEHMLERNLELINLLEEIGENHERTIAQVALAWLLSHEWITSPIIGPETTEQLEEDIASTGFLLKKEEIVSINSFTHVHAGREIRTLASANGNGP